MDGTGLVYWNYRAKQSEPVPVYVWAYAVQGVWTPVTGDYDMWMVAPTSRG